MKTLVGAYTFYFKDSGKFYIGSSKNLSSRKSHHLYTLKHGIHSNPKVQEEYNRNPDPNNLIWTFFKTDDREQAYVIEEQILSNYNIDDPLLLNISSDVRSSISGFELSAADEKKRLKNLRTSVRTKEHRLLKSDKTFSIWEDPERRKARSGAGNPFAKPIVCYGVLYGSVKEAEKDLKINEKKIRFRANDPDSPNINWFKGDNSEYQRKFNEDYVIDYEKIKRNHKFTSDDSKYMKSRLGSNNGASRKIFFKGVIYDSMQEAIEKSGYSSTTINRSFRRPPRV